MTLGQILIFSVSVFLLLLYVFLNWFIHILAILYGRNKLHKAPPPLCSEDIQGVSIIKPLVGVDPNLYHNLETFFYLDYPTYELLFSVHDEHDPAIMVVEKLIEKHPRVDAKLFKGIKYVGPNGKVNNMVKPFQASRYDLIVISDSSIKASPKLLKDMVGHMTPRIGLVIQMPFVCDRKGFSGVLEKVFFGTMQARNALAANAVGVNCSSGSNSLVRKEILEAAGGISAFGKYLAEDHFIAIETTKHAGVTVMVKYHFYRLAVGASSFSDRCRVVGFFMKLSNGYCESKNLKASMMSDNNMQRLWNNPQQHVCNAEFWYIFRGTAAQKADPLEQVEDLNCTTSNYYGAYFREYGSGYLDILDCGILVWDFFTGFFPAASASLVPI